MESALKISKNALGSLKVILSRIAHVLIGLLNSRKEVWPGESEGLQSTNQALIGCRIR